jgi:hypothetical protein
VFLSPAQSKPFCRLTGIPGSGFSGTLLWIYRLVGIPDAGLSGLLVFPIPDLPALPTFPDPGFTGLSELPVMDLSAWQ